MVDSMGTFRTRVELENPLAPGTLHVVPSALVDTGAALSWFPGDVLRALHASPLKLWHFRQADGTVVARWTTDGRRGTCAGRRGLMRLRRGTRGDALAAPV